MKKIFKIAKNELYTLFYSPIAWILMIIYVVMISMAYLESLEGVVSLSDQGGPALMYLKNLTAQISIDPLNGFFISIMKSLYMFFPLITMGLISRETSSGTMKLLLSSPLKIREIVLGKFVAMIGFTLVFLLLSFFIIIGLCFTIVHPDPGQIFASLFGLFLVLCSYAAIGLFISALTSYQIVAALVTFAVLILLSGIGGFWQNVDLVRDVTFYMNISGKSSGIVAGFLNLRDVVYFLIIIGSFIGFTIVKLKSDTESISKMRKALRYTGIVLVAFVVGYITNIPRFNIYYDATRDKLHTISVPTREMLAGMNDGELEIAAYSNLFSPWFGSSFAPSQKNALFSRLWEQYIRFKPDIKITYNYYYYIDSSDWRFRTNKDKSLKEIAEKEAKIYKVNFDRFWSPEEARKHIDIDKEENRDFFILKYKGRSTVLRTFNDAQFLPGETEFSAAVNRLLSEPPKVSFVTSEMERAPFSERTRDYKLISSQLGNRYALINQGYDFDTLSLRDKDIPPGLAAVVIADPRTSFTTESLDKIYNYIDEGGNLFLTMEPDRKNIAEPILKKLGLSLRGGLLVQPSDRYSSDVVVSYMTDSATDLSRMLARQTNDRRKYELDSLFSVVVSGASAIDYRENDGFHVTPLLYTDSKLAWNRLAPVDYDSLQLKVEPRADDEHGTFYTGLRLNRQVNGKDQRIFVFSDADFITGPHLRRPYNYLFAFSCFSTFSYGKFPANTEKPESLDNAVKITGDDIGLLKLIYYWGISGIIGLVCSVTLIRRKRK